MITKRRLGTAAIALLAVLPLCASAAPATGSPASDRRSATADAVLTAGERMARLQLNRLASTASSAPVASTGSVAADPVLAEFIRMESPANPRSWHHATFWLGMTELADRSSASWLDEAIVERGRSLEWRLGDRLYNADDHLIGASYLWAARHGGGRQALGPLRASFDQILAEPPRAHLALYVGSEGMRAIPKAECLKRWCWADALFMAPATWLGLSAATGDQRYRDYAMSEFWAASNFLYDPAERLYFRDSRFFDQRDEQGRKIFWSRGNGWVLAGLAQMLDALPARDPDRPRLEAHFREFAGRVAALQKRDGFWPSSLLATSVSTPESSGTALFTYGLAWGIANGLLPRQSFEPPVRRGWQALQSAIRPDGSLGWVQPAGDRPGPATADSSQIYATGAYLLAASAVADLERKR